MEELYRPKLPVRNNYTKTNQTKALFLSKVKQKLPSPRREILTAIGSDGNNAVVKQEAFSRGNDASHCGAGCPHAMDDRQFNPLRHTHPPTKERSERSKSSEEAHLIRRVQANFSPNASAEKANNLKK